MPPFVYITVIAAVFQGWALWTIHRLSKQIARDLRATFARTTCTCHDDKTMSPTGGIAGPLSCPIHETNLALGAAADYRHAPCPTCGRLVIRSAS